uniref:Organic anion transporting polypeptide 30B, isoform A n=4 Tax=Drosophila melanogaster TaxID=7227 RepID=Q9VLB3_DROME|nr:organic anion transporting polypeptide 30B, isoform B [Drosophila melanogaster]NP_723463.1 organic anion transporting polypeptide 30B, isoform A [Drosophila melanogaster]NP_995668.1 organic anion transporting polypeptide 30B, isoform C [Drosophila melanogaster]AAF52781.2 organic anion transporting polypeptide 30B, isoform A [Drosophila melanogaster]AAN10695.1 organic anion transporting polypeptide 30B, isoform B [Drosophila melanogaster]AAS64664.1 organic anion transporting polypeptide 30B,|eukprot:NP_609293.2 organic anion transporting polypeptide 30B, isoform B [Drosophila melanogaster]
MSAKHIEQYTNPSFEQESDQPPDPLGGVADVGAGNASSSSNGHIANDAGTANRKGHRRQESMYQMTGLYSETNSGDDSSIDAALDHDSQPHATSYLAGDQLPSTVGSGPGGGGPSAVADSVTVKCHSRQASAGKCPADPEEDFDEEQFRSGDCGILNCRPYGIQRFARIKIFVVLLSLLVMMQQALSSGYINSVITTIEKRFEIPSSYSGLIASSYEIGNVITVIFVSYLGSRRHIPVWIGIGAVIMGIGSLVFMVPHFTGEPNPGIAIVNKTSDNICKSALVRDQDMDLGRLSSGLSNQPLAPHTLREDNCLEGKASTTGPVLLFVLAQLLLGCGGSPLFTLGTTYVDDHVRTESSSMYIGFMYSMGAFGPVVGFLLGAYLLSFHMDSLSSTTISITPGDRRWVGMWWGGFLLCGVILLVVAVPFFSFPKVLAREKKKIRKSSVVQPVLPNNSRATVATDEMGKVKKLEIVAVTSKEDQSQAPPKVDTGYGKDIKDIPQSMLRLVKNPVYIVTCLGACMELMIVSGFVVFLPKYLETQFSLGKSQANIFTGSIAVPGACIGIFLGGCILKRFQLKPKGAVQFVLITNVICLACYAMLFFLGCDNLKMAGTTIPYYTSNKHGSTLEQPFQVNLTAACNFGCECLTSEVEPVCGNNGLTYFSPCHAGCTAFSSTSNTNYTNCACVRANISSSIYRGAGGSQAQALSANENFAEVTVVPVATAGPCATPCRTIYPFLILLFFMTFLVASTQMPLLMIVLRSVSEEERSFALGMQFVIFRLFGYIPAPILFGNLIDSTCILWKSSCGEKGGRCLIYDIEKFRYKYVGLCASVKLIALVIFMVDWWLVRRRKQLEKMKPLNASDPIIGSIISLDKLFEEKLSGAEPSTAFVGGGGELIIPTDILRHSRNDSRTMHMDYCYDKCGRVVTPANTCNQPQTKSKKHFRSASCDVKMIKSFARDHSSSSGPADAAGQDAVGASTKYKNLKKFQAHTRNHSTDLHDPSQPIRYIQNQLRPQDCPEEDDDEELTTGCGHFVKKHSRNHSYDQIYMPNNIRFDADFLRHPHSHHNPKKNVNVLKNVVSDVGKLKNSNEIEAGGAGSRGHSRNNSKDLNTKISSATPASGQVVTDASTTGLSVLRHRRTNSKDLNYQVLPESAASSSVSGHAHPQHTRNTSHHKIQIDDDRNELINDNDDEEEERSACA